MITALILANGDPPTAAMAQGLAAQCDLLIATDGAAHKAVTLGIVPDILCGDFDSIDMDAARAAFPNAQFIPTPDQNHADLEKALLIAREHKAVSIVVMGASGGRMDHTLANYALLLQYGQGSNLIFRDRTASTFGIKSDGDTPGVLTLNVTPDDIVSLIAFSAAARVSISGVKWELDDHLLLPGTQGVSNVPAAETVTVSVSEGALIVCHLPLQTL